MSRHGSMVRWRTSASAWRSSGASLSRYSWLSRSVRSSRHGAGAHFKGSVAFLGDLPTPPRRVLYFGDLDVDGLDIPVHASAVSTTAGLPAIEPTSLLYRLLLDHGQPVLVENHPSRHRLLGLTAWLQGDVRADAIEVLAGGRRLAQEWVGTELLGEHRELLSSI